MGVPTSVPPVAEDTSLAAWSDVLGIPQGLGQEHICSAGQPRGRHVQHFSSLDCVINPNGGPTLLGLRLWASHLGSLCLKGQSCKGEC